MNKFIKGGLDVSWQPIIVLWSRDYHILLRRIFLSQWEYYLYNEFNLPFMVRLLRLCERMLETLTIKSQGELKLKINLSSLIDSTQRIVLTLNWFSHENLRAYRTPSAPFRTSTPSHPLDSFRHLNVREFDWLVHSFPFTVYDHIWMY